jgi:hypothetical protein
LAPSLLARHRRIELGVADAGYRPAR